ncbi:MarR family transcriptional regulator [Rhodococcus sp. ABRD24]|uniref:MarR family winged helix-turn-helix transcriptional regulator n=1 Tax=Rhodococcus sp. ABRD24 TaxID=2507582 RepID=UPI00103BACC6|nr:MarR family winged helix-turn-helix transcriptional regulator [Rhodococcus sp. ABRD24]QBJ97849.1 MarR family transcriptional regulator [Rhodococcus sp. ABRD24]
MQQETAVDEVAAVHAELVQLARQLVTGGRAADGAPSFAQHSVLSYIGRNPGCRATEISDAFGVNRSTVSRQLRGCVDAGWVLADSGSVRAGHPLQLTGQGIAVVAAADRRRFDDVRTRVQGWSATEIAQFARLLHRFRTGAAPTVAIAGDDTHA